MTNLVRDFTLPIQVLSKGVSTVGDLLIFLSIYSGNVPETFISNEANFILYTHRYFTFITPRVGYIYISNSRWFFS